MYWHVLYAYIRTRLIASAGVAARVSGRNGWQHAAARQRPCGALLRGVPVWILCWAAGRWSRNLPGRGVQHMRCACGGWGQGLALAQARHSTAAPTAAQSMNDTLRSSHALVVNAGSCSLRERD